MLPLIPLPRSSPERLGGRQGWPAATAQRRARTGASLTPSDRPAGWQAWGGGAPTSTKGHQLADRAAMGRWYALSEEEKAARLFGAEEEGDSLPGNRAMQPSREQSMANAESTVRIPPPSDRRVLKFFSTLAELYDGSTFVVAIPGTSLGSFQSADTFFDQFADQKWSGRLISRVTLRRPDGRLSVTFRRSTADEASAWENELWIDTSSNNPPRPEEVLSVAEAVDAFRKSLHGKDGQETPYSAASDLIATQIATMAELQAELLAEAQRSRLQFEKDTEERRRELEREADQQKAHNQAEFDRRLGELRVEQDALSDRARQLDDRDHMHARRKMREDITSSLRERLQQPGVSRETRQLRIWFIIGSAFGIVAFAVLAGVAAWDLHSVLTRAPDGYSLPLIVAAVRFSVPAALAGALLIYVLGWLKHLHAEDSRSERDLERYRYDIDRASWAIETILEVQGKEGGTVPDAWIGGVTSGLFSRADASSSERDAVDALSSLFNFAAKAEFGPNGPKLEFNRPGLRRLSREVSSAAD